MVLIDLVNEGTYEFKTNKVIKIYYNLVIIQVCYMFNILIRIKTEHSI